MTESQSARPPVVRTDDVRTVGELRTVLSQIPDDAVCGPYVAEWSQAGNWFALYHSADIDQSDRHPSDTRTL